MKKKFVSMVLALVMCLTLIPTFASAADMSLLAGCPYVGNRSSWSMSQDQAAAYANVLNGASSRLSKEDSEHIYYFEDEDDNHQLDTYAALFDVNGSTYLWVCGIAIHHYVWTTPMEAPWGNDSESCYEVLMNEIWYWDGSKAVQLSLVKNYTNETTNVLLRSNGLELYAGYSGMSWDGETWDVFYPFSGTSVSSNYSWARALIWIYDFMLDEFSVSRSGKQDEAIALEYLQKRINAGTWIPMSLDLSNITVENPNPLAEIYYTAVRIGTGYKSIYTGSDDSNNLYNWPWFRYNKNDSGVLLCAETIPDNDGSWAKATEVAKSLSTFASSKNKSGFSDVPDSSPFSEAVAWAVSKGITTGVTTNSFEPSTACTNNHILTFLWRSQGSPTSSGSNDFAKAINWAQIMGIVSATVDGNLPCTRASAVSYLWRLSGSPENSTSVSFVDVSLGNSQALAIAWAVSKGITNGTDATHFSPDTICTRGQIVTFLYRAFA